MLTIRKKAYHTEHSRDTTLTRLTLLVEPDSELANQMLGDLTVDTAKLWVGEIQNSGSFSIVQANPYILPFRYLEGNFFSIYIYGDVTGDEKTSKTDVVYDLGINAILLFISIWLFPAMLTIKVPEEGDAMEMKSWLVPLLITLIPPTALMVFQLKKLDNEIRILLGVRPERKV